MKQHLVWFSCLLFGLAPWPASAQGAAVNFHFQGAGVSSPRVGNRVELLPVLQLLGADAAFSPSAGTYAVVYQDHVIQFAPGHTAILVDGVLREGSEAPTPSPGGVAASLSYLEQSILGPLGYHLETATGGFRITEGARFADPLQVRSIAADFASTTTLVLELQRVAEVEVDGDEDGRLVVRFKDASPLLDSSIPLRSRRVQQLVAQGQQLEVVPRDGVGLLSWNVLENPPRIILELGAVRPTPTPAPITVLESSGPPPIVIDPGHGGDDTGAVSASGLSEKDLTLAIARRLAQTLRSQGLPVRLTRSGDEARALLDRTALANRLDAVVFVSLHANASTVAAVRGAETYYMSLDHVSATDAAAAATAMLENQASESSETRDALDLILWDLAQSEVLNESSRLALQIQQHLNRELGLRDRGVKQAPFVVLTGATMPAALVEVGFLSHRAEAELLADGEHQQRVAEAIARGIVDFVGQP